MLRMSVWWPYSTMSSCNNSHFDCVCALHVLQVTTMQVLQFKEYPADGPGALRVTFQEELADQFVILGSLPMGLWTIRTDPGTPLNWVRDTVRGVTGRVIAVTTPVVVQLLQAVGWIKQ